MSIAAGSGTAAGAGAGAGHGSTVTAEPLAVPGAWVFRPEIRDDDRGSFATPFQHGAFTGAVGHSLTLAQVNTSVSRRGVLRGVHYSAVPPGQAKYVQCVSGALLDVVVDLRRGSPTFGRWDAVRLDRASMAAVYLAEGLGHAFLALEDETVVQYLCSTGYAPASEHGVDPLDPALDLPWSDFMDPTELVLSAKDLGAPSLAEAQRSGTLPVMQACRERAAELAAADVASGRTAGAVR